MKKDTLALFVYLGLVFLITMIHHVLALGVSLLVVFSLAGKSRWRIAKKATVAIAAFNSIVTVSYVVLSVIQGSFSAHFVLLVNIRVFLLTYLTFLFIEHVNPLVALSFSRTLTYLFSLAYGQLLTFRRLFEDSRMAFKSRSLQRPRSRDVYKHRAATASFFLQRSLHDATEITDAMKSRGFFND